MTLSIGNCGIPGAACVGDTYIELMDDDEHVFAFNDDGAPPGCGKCSYLQYTNPSEDIQEYIIRQRCNPPLYGRCNGVTLFTLTDSSRRMTLELPSEQFEYKSANQLSIVDFSNITIPAPAPRRAPMRADTVVLIATVSALGALLGCTLLWRWRERTGKGKSRGMHIEKISLRL